MEGVVGCRYRRCAIFDNKAEDILGVLEGCIAFMEQAKFYGKPRRLKLGMQMRVY